MPNPPPAQRKLLFPALLALATFAAGFACARLFPSPESSHTPSAPETASATTTPSRTLSTTPRLAQSKSLAPRLAFVRSLSRATPDDYPRLLDRVHDTDPRAAALIVNTWAKTDPQACFDHFLQTPDLNLFPALFREWANHDPETALAAAVDPRLEPTEQERSLRQLFSTLLNDNPAHAFSLLEKTLTNYPHLDFTPDFGVRDWTNNNPGVMAKGLANLPDSDFRSVALRQVVRRWFDQDPAGAATWLATTDAQDNWWIASSLVNKWVATDPAGAAQYVSENIVGEYRDSLTAEVAKRWAEQDPEAAFDWVTGSTWGHPRRYALGSLFSSLGRENPEAALALLDRIPDPGQRHRATQSLVSTWCRKHPGKAIEWVTGNVGSFENRNESALRTIADSWSSANATWASKHTAAALAEDPHALPVYFTNAIAQNYATRHPDRTVDWALALPPGHSESALSEALDYWMDDHPGPATNHVLQQIPPDHPRRTETLKTITTLYQELHGPEAARTFIDTLESQQERAALFPLID